MRCSKSRSRPTRRRCGDQSVRPDRVGRAVGPVPKAIDGVRVIAIDVPGFGAPTMPRRRRCGRRDAAHARLEAEARPVARPRAVADLPTVTLIGDLFSRPIRWGWRAARAMVGGRAAGAVAGVARSVWRIGLRGRGGGATVLHRIDPRMVSAGRPVVGSGPVRVEGTAAWLDAGGQGRGVSARCGESRALPAIRAAMDAAPIDARITVSGYESSELLVARLLIEAGARCPMWARPARRRNGASPIASGWKQKARTSSTEPRWSRMWQR